MQTSLPSKPNPPPEQPKPKGDEPKGGEPRGGRPKPNGWAFEGVACYVLPDGATPPQGVLATPFFRAWNGSDHFYTASLREYSGLPPTYQKEGTACLIEPEQTGVNVPLYRLYNRKADDHLYTTSVSEKDRCLQSGWSNEGIAGYVRAGPSPLFVEFLRAYNHQIADHFYTTSFTELDKAAPSLSSSHLQELLHADMGSVLQSDVRMYMADASYFPPMLRAAAQIIKDAKVHTKAYTSEVFDCDDFAHVLKAAFIEDAYTNRGVRTRPHAMGIVWGTASSGGGHAMNVIVLVEDGDYRVKIIEPQTGVLHAVAEKKLYDIYFAVL